MPQSTLLNLTLDRLGPTYVAGKVHLALTHSVGLMAEAAIEAPELLRPWTWKDQDGSGDPPKQVQLFTKSQQGWEKLGGPLSMLAPPPPNDALRQELDGRYDVLKDRPSLFVLDPLDPPSQTETDPGTRWPHLLEAVLRLPVPLGAQIRLARLIEVDPAALGQEEIVAAPLLAADGVSWTPDVVEERGSLRRVVYVGTGTGTLEALTPGYKPARDTAARQQQSRTESHLDLKQLWVQLPERFGGRAWLGELPYEAADTADLARHLLDALEDTRAWLAEQQQAAFTATGEAVPRGLVPARFAERIRDAILAALRLAAHAGAAPSDPDDPDQDLRPQPPLPRSARELLRQLGMADQWTAIRDYERDHELGSPPDAARLILWRDLLTGLDGSLSAAVARLMAQVPAAGAVPLVALSEAARSLAGLVRDDAVASRLMAAHWDKAGVEPRAGELASALRSFQLRRRLILDRLDKPWGQMTRADAALSSVGDEAAAMRSAFAGALWSLAAECLGLPKDLPEPTGTPVDDDAYLTWRLVTALRGRLSLSAQALGPETAEAEVGTGPASPAASAQPLSLVAGQLRTPETAPDPGDDFAPSARIAGIGVLLRQRKAGGGPSEYGPWRALTMARPAIRETGTILADHALVPVPVVEMAGLESWTITYDNHPLTAESLGVELSQQVELAELEGQGTQPLPPLELRVRLQQVPGNGASPGWAYELPMLKYGQHYEIACFGVANSGALPKELCAPGEPFTFADPSAAEPPEPQRFVRRLRHLRRTRVGPPRLVGPARGTPFALPPLPAQGIFPRATDILRDTQGDADAAGLASTELGPLLLLVGPDQDVWNGHGQASHRFGVRPPAVELTDWHCWKAMDLFEAGLAQNDPLVRTAWQEVRRNAPKPGPDGKLPPESMRGQDLSLDDLAVARIGFRLREVAPDGTLGQSAWEVPPALGLAASPIGLDLLQALPGVVSVEAVARGSAPSLGATWPLKVEVPSGKVCRLEIASLVPARLYPHGQSEEGLRFRSNPALTEEPVTKGGETWVVAAIAPLTVEVATADMPDPATLWQAIGVLGRRGDELVVGLDPLAEVPSPGQEPSLDHVKEVRLTRQMWGWRGRSLPTAFPAQELSNAGVLPKGNAYALENRHIVWRQLWEWDGAGFGDRSDEDHLVHEGVLPGPARAATGADRLALGAPLHRISLSSDRRAQYWRYRVEARSRYRGLMREPDRSGLARSREWKRLVIPDRLTEPMPRPRLRFLLPLTQASSGDTSQSGWAAPLLALFDETWSATAGPGERLEVAVVRTASGRQEFGPDPIDSASGPAGEVAAEPSPQPFGLTFDIDAEAGLPVTTAWEIRLRGSAVRPGTFAKLSFRRMVDPHLDHRHDPRASIWTDPVWVQLLPDFTRWQVQATGVAGPVGPDQLRLTAVGGLQACPGAGQAWVDAVLLSNLPDQLDALSPRKRRIYILVTKVVREAASPQQSEVPLCLGAVEGTAMPAYAPAGRLGGPDLRARLLEVEHREGHGIADADTQAPLKDHPLFRALFPEQQAADTPARLVRVSPPFVVEA